MTTKYLALSGLTYLWGKIKAAFVPITRTVNGKTLSANVTLTAADVGAAEASHTHSDYLAINAGAMSANPAVGTAGVRNIIASTTDLTAGTSSLTTGQVYLVYE